MTSVRHCYKVMTMQDLRHPNCVQLIGACSKPPNLCIVMEYADNGDLFQRIQQL